MLLFGWRIGVTVAGESMTPSLNIGDRLVVDPRTSVRASDVVLAKHPFKKSVRILKRVSSIGPNGRIFLSGDNPSESSDSRVFGTVSGESIIGKVVARFQ
jgi:nickel-type superoxide dismutase maturation protease